MTSYLIRRVLQVIPITFGILTLVFALVHFIPGDPAVQLAGENARPQDIERIRHDLGLDKSIPVQYINYLAGIARLDLGKSFRSGEPVVDELVARYPATLQLALGGMLIALITAFPLGVIAAVYRDTWIDNVARLFSLVGVSMPNFWLGPLLIIAFAVHVEWFPVSGREEGLKSLVLPSITLGLSLAAILTRMIRVSLTEEMGQLYVITAMSKGIERRVAIVNHALRNALIPVITIIGLQFGSLLTGAIITEQIFSWPGLGRLLLQSISARDYPQMQGSILVIALTYILVNLLTDVLYAFVDPRIQYE